MAIQKHNIYYDASKPESGIYYYAENGEQKELFLNNVLSGENGISAISAVDGNTWVIGITDDYKDNIEKIPGLSDNFVILSADVGNKLYVSATDNWDVLPYIGSTNISIHDHIIDFQNTANLIGDDTYIAVISADNNIVVSALKDFVDKEYVDEAIASAAPTSAVANKLDKAVFSAYSADIALQLNNISADKLDTSAFTAYSAHALDDYYKKTETSSKQEIQNALDEKQDNLTNEQLSAISSVSAIQSISANWLTEEDIKDFITEDEVESVSSTLTAQTNYLSGIIDTKLDTIAFDTYTATALNDYYTKDETKGLINDLSGTVSSQLNNKLDTSTFAAYSGNINNQINTVSSEVDKKLYTSATNDWDVTPYSGINGIKVENHLISVSANYALSADVYSKSQIDDIIANFGGFQIVSEDAQGKPDVSDPSTKIIYLTLVDDDPAAFDKYREWIWTNSEWECIGIASIDLKDYAKTQDVIASAVATSAWINNTFYNKTETSGKTEIQNALDTKLDVTAFNDYSDNIDDQLQTLSSVKLDTSAFTAYSADIESQLDTLSAIKLDKTYSATVNEQLTAKLDTSAFTAYSAEINTELNNITADVDKKLYTSATNNWDYIAYSGGQNVSVVDHIIDISGTKSLSGDGKNIEVVELADTFIISATKDIVDKSYVDNNFVSKTDFGTYSGNTKNQIDSKLDISAFTTYSATALNDYYKKSETSGKSEIQNALAEKQDNLTNEQLSAISSVSAIQSNTENWNAAYDTLTAYSADGKWLITDDITALATKNEVEIASGVLTAQTNYLSGIIDTKLDTTTFDTYTATALVDYYKKAETSGSQQIADALDEKQDNLSNEQLSAISSVSAIQAISGDWATKIEVENTSAILTAQTNYLSGIVDNKLDITAFDTALNDYYTKIETNTLVDNSIADISATVSADYLKKADVREYTAGNNIDITNYVVSGRDWTPELNTKVNSADFTAYSATIDSQLQNLTENKLDKTEFDIYSASTKTQIDSKLNKSDFDDYSAHALNNYYTKDETSGSQQIADALNTKLNKTDFDNYSANALNDYYKKSETSGKTEIQNALDTKLNTSAFTAYSGNVDTLLNNISANTTALSANKLDISAFTAYSATAFNDYYTKSETDTKITDAINDISATVSTDYLKKADVREYTAGDNIDITNYVISGKDWTSELNTKVNNTDFNTYSASTKTQIDSKLNKDDFNTYSAHADTTPYSGINGIKVENHLISVSANYALSADVYSKSEVDDIRDNIAKELAGLGFYDCKSDEIKANGEPDETVLETRELLSNNKIYLVKDNTAPVPDQYKEWIWNGTNWTCIGDTSISLVAYAKTQDVIASAVATSAWINNTFYDKTETSGKQQIQDALNTKLNTTVFNDYTATALNNYYTKDETSGKTEIQNALGTKLDTTAFNDYTATALNDIATNSGKWENSYTALTANSASWLKEADVAGFATKTELNNASSILINQDNYLSGVIDTKLDTTAFNNYSANALNDYYKKSETSGKTEIQNALGTKLDTTAFNNYSANVKTQIDSKLTKNDFDSYSAAVDNDIDYISAVVSSIPVQVQSDWEEANTASPAYIQNKPVDLEMSAGNGISITETNNILVFAVSGNYADATEVDTDINYLSGIIDTKLDTTAFNNYSANVKTQIDSKLTKNDFDSYSAIIDTDIDYLSAAINDIPAQVQSDWEETNTASPAYIQNKPIDLEMSAGNGISITEDNNTLIFSVSGKLDSTAFNSYSAVIDTDIDYLSAAINNSVLTAGTDLKIENGIISVNTDGTANSAYMAFVEGSATIASGQYSHAEGLKTFTSGGCNHAEGYGSSAISWEAHAEGNYTLASGVNSHAECSLTTAAGVNSHAEGYKTFAGYQAHSEGDSTSAFGNHSHAEGQYSVSQNNCSHAEGQNTSALSMHTHTEGGWTLANANAAHAEGQYTSALGYASHTEGYKTNATNSMGHAEGNITSAVGEMAHAEGSQVLAQGNQSHAEGNMTTAFGEMSHTEGVATLASGGTSHAEGAGTSALDYASHAEGYGTIAASTCMHAGGKYNKTSADALFVIGNGSATTARSDAFVVDWSGCASAVKLATSGIPDIEAAITGIPAQVQSDWEETNTASPAYIQNKPVDLEMSAGNGISITETNNTLVFAVSGNYADATEVNNKLTALSANKLDISATTDWDISAYSAGNNITIVDHVIDLRESKNLIGDGENIIVTESGSNIIVSALKDILDKDDFDSYSAIIDNDIDYISAAVSSIPAQVQSDWEETNTASPAYIQNKPADLELSAGNGISITETNNTLLFAVSGNYGKKTNDVYYIRPTNQYSAYSTTASYQINDIITYSDMVYSASAAVTPGSWGTNSAKFNKLSSVVFSADIDDITELYEGMKIAVAFTTRGGASDTKLNINELGEHYLYKNINTNITTGSFASGCVLYFTYFNDNWRSDQDSNSTYNAMVDAYVSLGATATNISAACTNFSAKPGSTINVTFPRDYTAVSAKKFRAGTSSYQPLYLNGSATSNTNYFIPSGTWPVYYDGDNWYLWTDGSIQFSAIRGTVIDCVKYNDIQYAIGSANTATGSTTARYSVALGNSNSAYNSFVIGNYNKGNESHIFGDSNSGINSYIVGNSCTGTESYLFGRELSGKSWGIELGDFGDTGYPVIVGRQNATKSSAYFVVGCGNTLGNADAFIVSSNKVASAADFRAGNGVSLSSLTGLATSSWVNGQIADAITSIPAQVQSDWSATNTASPAYILNKPNQIDMQCGTYLDITSANNQITLDANISAISAALSDYANIQSDWSATNTASPTYIQNKPDVLIPVSSVSFAAPTNIMVVTAMPPTASINPTTIYLVKENVS